MLKFNAILDHNISFMKDQYGTAQNFMNIRRANLRITRILWIDCRLRIDFINECYNPKTPILLWLN